VIEDQGLVPVFYHDDLSVCMKMLAVCYRAGLRIFEFTNRGENALKNFSGLLKYAGSDMPQMIIGAGTIRNEEEASRFINTGANFIVSPFMKKSIADACIQKDIYWIPGCGTVTEIATAEEWGAEIIKIFPGSVLGPDFIKAVKAPMPLVKLIVTGGVNPSEKNLNAWFSAGALGVGMGSQLFDDKLISIGKEDELEKNIKKVLHIIRKYK
jgi:2-dehydro-3-deoxyphosphogluconate aldolase/(4S)-4-hydroxy-2-oxoglutarate aldolase